MKALKASFERVLVIFKFKLLIPMLVLRARAYRAVARRDSPRKINVGGGLFFRPGWEVLDYITPEYPYSKSYIHHDFDLCSEDPWPFENDLISFFFSSHMLEHIPQEFVPRFLSEMYRCTKPGGAVRLTMPDYDKLCNAYERKDIRFLKMNRKWDLGLEEFFIYRIAGALKGDLDSEDVRANYNALTREEFAEFYCSLASRKEGAHIGNHHKNWFNYEKLAKLLRDAGFKDVYESQPQESKFLEMRGEGGFLAAAFAHRLINGPGLLGIDTVQPKNSLFVEAVK